MSENQLKEISDEVDKAVVNTVKKREVAGVAEASAALDVSICMYFLLYTVDSAYCCRPLMLNH